MLYKVVWRGERANGVILFNELKPRVIGRVKILIDNNGYNGVRFWSLFVFNKPNHLSANRKTRMEQARNYRAQLVSAQSLKIYP